jgi:hypothetical protein
MINSVRDRMNFINWKSVSIGSISAAISFAFLLTTLPVKQETFADELPAIVYKAFVYRVPPNECTAPQLPDAAAGKEGVDRVNSRITEFNDCLARRFDRLDTDFEMVKSAVKRTRKQGDIEKINVKLEAINKAIAQANDLRKKVDAMIAVYNDKVVERDKQVEERNIKVEERNKLVLEYNREIKGLAAPQTKKKEK